MIKTYYWCYTNNNVFTSNMPAIWLAEIFQHTERIYDIVFKFMDRDYMRFIIEYKLEEYKHNWKFYKFNLYLCKILIKSV